MSAIKELAASPLWYCARCRTQRRGLYERGKLKVRTFRSGFTATWLECGHTAAVAKDRVR